MKYTIEAIDYPRFMNLYHTMLVNDFPKNELRPLFMFKNLYRKGSFQCLIMVDNGTILAYACIITNKEAALLDYFAVNKTMRGNGLGSLFLNELKNYISFDGIIIESELPYEADTEKEKLTRTKRVSFYKRNGATITNCEWHAFGVGYHLLWKPLIDNEPGQNIDRKIKSLYREAMPGIVVRLFTKLKEPWHI